MVGDHVLPVEYGVGYAGIASRFRVFESYAQMHLVYGMRGGDARDGSFYDAVIPNSYDPADFPFQEQKEDYLLFMGRLVARKGPHVAAEVARRAGMPLVVAGQGGQQQGDRIVAPEVVVECPGLRYMGFADRETRGLLMSRARAVIVPTLYVEPFGGVAAEAQLCGTPVITTDWGAFTETVLHGRTGYRCRTLEQFTWAARNAQSLSPREIRQSAVRRFSLARASRMYGEYFRMLADLWEEGWYAVRERSELDWLNDEMPAALSGEEQERPSGPRR
jgi:glycosyltransferase involved in cell wall biosynthesis